MLQDQQEVHAFVSPMHSGKTKCSRVLVDIWNTIQVKSGVKFYSDSSLFNWFFSVAELVFTIWSHKKPDFALNDKFPRIWRHASGFGLCVDSWGSVPHLLSPLIAALIIGSKSRVIFSAGLCLSQLEECWCVLLCLDCYVMPVIYNIKEIVMNVAVFSVCLSRWDILATRDPSLLFNVPPSVSRRTSLAYLVA